ncbi:MAG: hypothetical protein Q8930_15155 [Bacillota bacterium]|nr:hypothetical protein [Bacillota bacterium]
MDKLKEKRFKIKTANNAFKDTFGYATAPEERAEDFISIRTFFDLTDYNYQCFQSAFCNNGIPAFTSSRKWEIIREGNARELL